MTLTTTLRNWLMAIVAVLLGAVAMGVPTAAQGSLAGSQGTDTSLPRTDSAVTVNGRGKFASLEITVNQTRNLTNQAVSITWKGGDPTKQGPGRFASNYLQIFQCWGDDDGLVPSNPGPPPEQCVQGAVAGTFGGVGSGLYPAGFALSRVVSRTTWANYDPGVGVADPRTTNVWLPFVAVDGEVVEIQVNSQFQPTVQGGNFWLNPYFGIATTNEIAGGATGPDGTGAELMEVLTGVQSTGLGCGQRAQRMASGELKVPQCWIVVVPRGTPSEENQGTPFEANADQNGVATSPVSPTAWANRVSIPIEFNPVDNACSIGSDERRFVGNELFFPAVASWQPKLCEIPGLPAYSYAPVGDATARRQLTAGAFGSTEMAAVSRPLEQDATTADNPVVYAPVAGLGVVIGFNVERFPNPGASEEIQQLGGVRLAEINLTPRLVAKLLTQSYTQQLPVSSPPAYEWDDANPPHLGLDPDFLRFNPEFELLLIANARTFSGLQLPAGNSDAALQVWEWILADPEARAWLEGSPDEWGMRVNPIYATNASVSSSGSAFGDPLPNSFPKGDPYCFQASAQSQTSPVPPPLCGTDWMPYARGFQDAAQVARTASDGARIVQNPFAQAPSEVWARELPQFVGRRAMLALTDSASAARFGLQTARLSRAGDNGPDRVFVPADAQGLRLGLASLEARSTPGFLEPSTAPAPAAYPLATLVYAALTPLSLDAGARADFAAFIEYAVGPGQVPGLALGQLPRGYVELNEELRGQALAAATVVRTLTPPTPPTPPPPAPLPEAPGTVPPSQAPGSLVTPPAPSRATGATGSERSQAPASSPSTSDTTDVATTEPAPEDSAETDGAPVVDQPAPEQDAPAVTTPELAVGRARYAVAGAGILALASMLGALEISKRPRRAVPATSTVGAKP
ncbi:MAG TPA: hypothetical protein VK853_09655 [Ilumatobacteraceae bacterium]|nr:hypothetical protein [Ilumatobacteraceae bacterium]